VPALVLQLACIGTRAGPSPFENDLLLYLVGLPAEGCQRSAGCVLKVARRTSKSIARNAPRPVSFISRQALRVRSRASLAFQTACGILERALGADAPGWDPAVALPPDDWRILIGGPAPPCLTLRLCLSS
jgi:hypothetical protein